MPNDLKLTYEPIVANESYPIKSFLRIPKELLEKDEWKSLSVLAIVLYALLFERMLSSKDSLRFRDKEGYPFIIFRQKEAADILRVTEKTVGKYLTQLEEAELITREHQYLTVPDIIHVRYYAAPMLVPLIPSDSCEEDTTTC